MLKRSSSEGMRTRVYRTLFPLVVLLFSTSVNSNAQSQTPTPQSEEPRNGSISGRVVNDSGQPLGGVTVYARAGGTSGLGRTATTNIDGNFQIKGLDPALYYVSANAPAYVAPIQDTETPLPTYRVGDSVRIELVRGGVITGIVTNSTNEPLVGTRVRAFMVKDVSGKSTKGRFSFGDKATDDRGVYRIYGLAPGTYLVQAGGGGLYSTVNAIDLDAPTFAPSSTRDSAAEIQVRGGEETNVDIRYRGEPGHSVSGTVKSTGSTGASISLTMAGDGVMPTNGSYMQPGSRGFSIYGVADGDYDIMAQEIVSPSSLALPDLALSEPMRISVRGADITGLELVPKLLGLIGGKVVLEQSKLPDCQNKRKPLFSETLITLVQNRKENEVDQTAIVRLFSSTALLDRDGAFLLKNVRQGQYTVSTRFFARYWYLKGMTVGGPAPAVAGAKPMPALPKDAARNWTTLKWGDRVTGLTITLSEGAASVRGKIEKPEDRKLEPGLRVYLVPAERDKVDDPLRYFISDVGGDLSFALNNLPPGRYLAIAQPTPANTPSTTDTLRLPDALEARTKIRRAAEAGKLEIELKPCQNITDYGLKLN